MSIQSRDKESRAMSEYLCTEHKADGAYSRSVFADTEEEARQKAAANGWTFDGQLFARIPADELTEDGANELIRMLAERDEQGMSS